MCGHGIDQRRDAALDFVQKPGECGRIDGIRVRMGRAWHYTLPHQHLDPAGLGEQFLVLAVEVSGRAKQVESRREAVGQDHGAAAIPERLALPHVRGIMQDQEIAHAFPFEASLAIELLRHRRRRATARQHRKKPRNNGLDQVDARRFKRLDKAVLAVGREIERNRDTVSAQLGEQCGAIFSAHLQMLNDEQLRGQLRQRIREKHNSPEFAVSRTLREYAKVFQSLDSGAHQALASDIFDIEKRLRQCLSKLRFSDARGTQK